MRQGINPTNNWKELQQRKLNLDSVIPVQRSGLQTSAPFFSRRAKAMMASVAGAAILAVGVAVLRAGGAKAEYQASQGDRLAKMPLVVNDENPKPPAPPQPNH